MKQAWTRKKEIDPFLAALLLRNKSRWQEQKHWRKEKKCSVVIWKKGGYRSPQLMAIMSLPTHSGGASHWNFGTGSWCAPREIHQNFKKSLRASHKSKAMKKGMKKGRLSTAEVDLWHLLRLFSWAVLNLPFFLLFTFFTSPSLVRSLFDTLFLPQQLLHCLLVLNQWHITGRWPPLVSPFLLSFRPHCPRSSKCSHQPLITGCVQPSNQRTGTNESLLWRGLSGDQIAHVWDPFSSRWSS